MNISVFQTHMIRNCRKKDEFWDAFVVTSGSCDYLDDLLAAADELDEQTIFNLLEGLNENEMWGMKLQTAVKKWIWVHPEETQDIMIMR